MLRLRRRLQDSLSETPYQNYAERRFLQAMIDLLYCTYSYDSGLETIIDSVRKLTLRPRLANILSGSTSESHPHGHSVRVPSPSGRF